MGHTLEIEDFREWLNEESRVMYASSTNSNGQKRLYVTCDSVFEVEVNGDVVFKTMVDIEAVNKYNEL